MERIRGGRGFGDSIYIRPIAEHFVRSGRAACVLSDYPEVFIGSGARVEPFNRHGANIVAHYVHGKENPATTQWQDVCRSARVTAPLRFEWRVRNEALIARIRKNARGRMVLLVHGGRHPMDRRDGFGEELLPTKESFDYVLAKLRDCYRVQIGRADQIYPLSCDLNLNGETSVADVLDLASMCNGIVAQCSFAVPLAEVFDKPLLAVWSARAAKSKTPFIRQTTPQKVLSAPRDTFIFDDWTADQIRESIRAFRNF